MDIVVRAVLLYLVLLLVLRATTRRVMRSATPLDMVLIFVVGGLSTQAIIGEDRSVTAALIAISAFAGTHVVLSLAKLRWPLVGRITDGPPVILFEAGRWQRDMLRQIRLQEEDVMSELRQQGLRNMDQVDIVVLEHNGGISIIRKE